MFTLTHDEFATALEEALRKTEAKQARFPELTDVVPVNEVHDYIDELGRILDLTPGEIATLKAVIVPGAKFALGTFTDHELGLLCPVHTAFGINGYEPRGGDPTRDRLARAGIAFDGYFSPGARVLEVTD